jgi:hypothetical protein
MLRTCAAMPEHDNGITEAGKAALAGDISAKAGPE